MKNGSKLKRLSLILKHPRTSHSRRRLSELGAIIVAFGVYAALFKPGRANASSGSSAVGPPEVAVTMVARENLFKEVTISAEFRPYEEVELHAKVSGYLQQINVDFGDEVKTGQLLAVLEVPELKDQLDSAVAAMNRTVADYKEAHLTFTRLQTVNREHPNLVAQQDLDTAQAKDDTTSAALAATKADVERYQTLIAYTKITAPFDGVITKRYADPGALIQSGTASDTQSMPLVRISDNYRLRLDFPVSVDYVKDVHLGDRVEVRVESLNGKSFNGKIARFTRDVDEDTRTMTTEIEVPNQDLSLIAGMYATVLLRVENRPDALAVPTEAVSGDKSPVVFVVNHEDQIEQRAVQLGLETPDKYEVLSGLREGEQVVIGNHSEFQNGQKVKPKLIQLSMDKAN